MATGIIYDLDGTIIDTEKLHEEGWIHALAPHGITPARDMLSYQKGRSGEAAAKYMLPAEMQHLVNEVREVKFEYVMKHLGEVPILVNFTETYEELKRRGVSIGICTSARPEFITALKPHIPFLEELAQMTVCKGMYERGKPDPQPLLTTLEKMGNVSPRDVIYVGDAESDYQMALNARIPFAYFCAGEPDSKIPVDVSRMNDHQQIFRMLENLTE